MVELKVALAIAKVYEVQLVNYLVATGLDEGLLLNFGPSAWNLRRNSDYRNRTNRLPSEVFC